MKCTCGADRGVCVECLEQKIGEMKKLLLAVKTGYFETYIDDVDGENWFDLRDRILREL